MELKDNGIYFDEDAHAYWKDGKELQGITKAIAKYVHPQKYDSISDSVMTAAADRGHAIHSAIELYCSMGMMNDSISELADFIGIKEAEKLETIANEYIVTDDEFYASPIDYVCKTPDCEENEVCIIDFKSTSSIDDIRLAVQLTVYKMFFERNNPDLKVKKVGYIWLPKKEYGSPKIGWIDSLNEDVVYALLMAYRNEEDFNAIEITKEHPLPVTMAGMETRIGTCITIGKSIELYLKNLKAALLEQMTAADVKSYKGEHLTISITKGYEKKGGYDVPSLLKVIDELLDGCPDDYVAEFKEKVNACKKPNTFISDSVTLKYV